MVKLKYKPALPNPDDPHWAWACELVEKLALAGYDIDTWDVMQAWEEYSETLCAGWIVHEDYDAEEIFSCIRPFVEIVEDNHD